MENLVERFVSRAYINGKLSVIDREIKAARRYIHTLESKQKSLMITLEDRTKLSEIQIQTFGWSYVDIVVDVSSDEEYIESDDKKDLKPIPLISPTIPTSIIEQVK